MSETEQMDIEGTTPLALTAPTGDAAAPCGVCVRSWGERTAAEMCPHRPSTRAPSQDRGTFDLDKEQHALGFPGCGRSDAHEHRLPISTFRLEAS